MDETKMTAGAEAPAAERNHVLVINRAGGRKLVIRIPTEDPDDPLPDDFGDAVMIEIFDEDMGKNFNPEYEIGHGGYMTAEIFTDAIRRVVDAATVADLAADVPRYNGPNLELSKAFPFPGGDADASTKS